VLLVPNAAGLGASLRLAVRLGGARSPASQWLLGAPRVRRFLIANLLWVMRSCSIGAQVLGLILPAGMYMTVLLGGLIADWVLVRAVILDSRTSDCLGRDYVICCDALRARFGLR
jgi:hypothetical protein